MAARKKNLLSLANVARRVDVPYARAYRALHSGSVVPDFLAGGRTALFREDRLAKLKEILSRPAKTLARV